jgi:hypothetical protein
MNKLIKTLLQTILLRVIQHYKHTSLALLKVEAAKRYVEKVEMGRCATRKALFGAVAGILFVGSLCIWVNLAILGAFALLVLDQISYPLKHLIYTSWGGAALLAIAAWFGIVTATSNKVWVKAFKIDKILAHVTK